jgi:hypothetical protein
MDDLEHTYTPAEAAEAFDFAPSLLRRYAAIYENAGGTIPHDRRGGRVYSRTMLEHFAQAREQVKAGETVEDALRTFDLAPAKAAPDAQTTLDAKQVLSQLERLADANEQHVEGLRVIGTRLEALDRLEAEVAALRAERVLPDTERPAAAPDSGPTENPSTSHGPIVKLAMWLEARWRRF